MAESPDLSWALAAPGTASSSTPPPNTAELTPQAARAELEQLRTARIEGKVTQQDYLARSEYLARLAEGERNVAPPREPYLTPEQQFERQWHEEIMAPAKPHEYQFPATPADDPEMLAADTAIRDAMSAIGIPRQWGGTIYETADKLLHRFQDASPEDIAVHTQSVGAQLRAQFGDEYERRVNAVNDMLAREAEKHEVLKFFLDKAPFVFADVRIMSWLDEVARHRAMTTTKRS